MNVIAALDRKRGIGCNGVLPWHLPPDLEYFYSMTAGSAVIVGRKTWESIPHKQRLLTGRVNIVLSRTPALSLNEPVFLAHCLQHALDLAQQQAAQTFVIGGGEVYAAALAHADCNRLFLTHIDAEFDCDTFFPPYEDRYKLESETEAQTYNECSFTFCIYRSLDSAQSVKGT